MLGNKYNIGVDARAEWKALKWTTETPTIEGWYWARTYVGVKEKIFVVEMRQTGIFITNAECPFPTSMFTHWLGPLPVPEPPDEKGS